MAVGNRGVGDSISALKVTVKVISSSTRRRRGRRRRQQQQHRLLLLVLLRLLVAVTSCLMWRCCCSYSSSFCFTTTTIATTSLASTKRSAVSLSLRSKSAHPRLRCSVRIMSTMATTNNNNNNHNNKNLVVVIAGSTGVGKSDVAARICNNNDNNGFVVSADSVQAYRGVQIGANKPTFAELQRTPHLLINHIDVDDSNNASSSSDYSAAEWRRDALYAIKCLLLQENNIDDEDDIDDDNNKEEEIRRREKIRQCIEQGRRRRMKRYHSLDDEKQPNLPVVVGGTMMYLQWLVHGRPDAVRPTERALQRASEIIAQYHNNNSDSEKKSDTNDDWMGAVACVSGYGDTVQRQVNKLSENDWYRLRRILEVALTVQEKDKEEGEDEKEGRDKKKIKTDNDGGSDGDNDKNDSTSSLLEKLYSGQREGGILTSTSSYDVRCFFLCPSDRMEHTKLVDERCEQMLYRGLIKETTDLATTGQLPDMAAKAIGYRQTLDYLGRVQREGNDDDDNDNDDDGSFQTYLEDFTTATRRYAKRQMQWFRRDMNFVFIPVDVSMEKETRVYIAANEVERMMSLSREQYDKERLSDTGMSVTTRKQNELQGKKMKFYSHKRQLLKPGSDELDKVLKEANECTQRYQSFAAKRPKTGESDRSRHQQTLLRQG